MVMMMMIMAKLSNWLLLNCPIISHGLAIIVITRSCYSLEMSRDACTILTFSKIYTWEKVNKGPSGHYCVPQFCSRWKKWRMLFCTPVYSDWFFRYDMCRRREGGRCSRGTAGMCIFYRWSLLSCTEPNKINLFTTCKPGKHGPYYYSSNINIMLKHAVVAAATTTPKLTNQRWLSRKRLNYTFIFLTFTGRTVFRGTLW